MQAGAAQRIPFQHCFQFGQDVRTTQRRLARSHPLNDVLVLEGAIGEAWVSGELR